MTIIAAISRPDLGYTVIGCDLRVTWGSVKNDRGRPKWVELGDRCWYGVSGYARADAVLYAARDEIMSETMPSAPDLAWAHRCTIRMRDVLQRDGFKPVNDDGPPRYGVGGIIVAGSKVFETDTGFGVYEVVPPEVAFGGCATEYAMGAAWMMQRLTSPPVDRMEPDLEMKLLLTAAGQSPDVGPEHWIGRVPHKLPERNLIVDADAFVRGQGAIV